MPLLLQWEPLDLKGSIARGHQPAPQPAASAARERPSWSTPSAVVVPRARSGLRLAMRRSLARPMRRRAAQLTAITRHTPFVPVFYSIATCSVTM